jgi:DNA repair photolyase
VVEPGTPPSGRMFEVIKKFTDAGVCCGVNVDPIMPLVTDTDEELEAVVRSCKEAGLRYVFGAMLRLRTDIWERMKLALRLLEIPDGIDRYKQIYKFEEPLDAYYVAADRMYAETIIGGLEGRIKSYGMECGFPDYIGSRRIDRSHLGQTTLHNFLM